MQRHLSVLIEAEHDANGFKIPFYRRVVRTLLTLRPLAFYVFAVQRMDSIARYKGDSLQNERSVTSSRACAIWVSSRYSVRPHEFSQAIDARCGPGERSVGHTSSSANRKEHVPR